MKRRPARSGSQRLPVDQYLSRLSSTVRRNTYRLLEVFCRALDPAFDPRTAPWDRLTPSGYARAAAAVTAAHPLRIVNAVRHRVLAVLRQERSSGRLPEEVYATLQSIPWVPRPGASESISGDAVLAMLRDCEDDLNDRGARDGALISLIWCHAWTTSELIRAQVADVDPAGCACAPHRQALQRWMEVRRDRRGPFLLGVTRSGVIAQRPVSSWAVVKSVERRAQAVGLRGITPELLRRSSILHTAGRLDSSC